MSEADKSPLDLTGLDFGPAWAKDKSPARDFSKEVGPREGKDRRGKGNKGPRRDNGGRQTDRRKDNRNDQRGDRRRNDRRGNDRRNQQREPRIETPAPEGFIGGVMPVEEGLDNLSKEIQGGGRTYSVFDLARVVMGARERFNVTFEAPKGTKFFRCKSNGSLWLTKEEAVRHFWQANLLDELYEQIETEVEAPKGNFSSVAKCGLSGQWLAPPNYHSYPTTVAQMHAERYAHMSLEDYKRKIRVESGEEVVAAWMETQTKKIQFRPLSAEEILTLRKTRKQEAEDALAKEAKEKKENPAKVEETPTQTEKSEQIEETETAEKSAGETEQQPENPEASPEVDADPSSKETAPEPVTEEPTTDSEAETEPEPEPLNEEASSETKPKLEEEPQTKTEQPSTSPLLLETRRDVERHFAEHHFQHIYAQVERAWVPGNVSAKLLSPGILTLLKTTVADERRYPSKLTPILCRQLSGRHLAVFKWKKKLKAGPARPHAVPDDIDLAERPQQMLAWINEHSGKTLEELWKANLPEDSNSETKRNFYHDFHWLLNQGFVILLADSTVHLAKTKAPEPAQKKKTSKTTSQNSPTAKEAKDSTSTSEEPAKKDPSPETIKEPTTEETTATEPAKTEESQQEATATKAEENPTPTEKTGEIEKTEESNEG